MLSTSAYQEFITDIIEMQSEYYVPLIFVGLIVMASVLMYKKQTQTKLPLNNLSNQQSVNSLHLNNPSKSSKSSKSSKPMIPSQHNINSLYTYNQHNINSITNNNNNNNNNPSSCSSSFSSSLSMDGTKPNQKYRKQDPDTRYDDDGTRYQCVAVPYRIVNHSKVEVFMITSRNRGDYIFPGGGWEKHETGPQCAQREAWEEAGIRGDIIKEIVSDQHYTSDKGNKSRLWGYLLNVTQVLEEWPETERRRKWMTINEAEIALSDKRRVKFGALWKNAIEYFIEQNLYQTSTVKSEDNKSQDFDHRILNNIYKS